MSSALEIDENRFAVGPWKKTRIKLTNVYSRPLVKGDTWWSTAQVSTRESDTSSIAPRLQTVLDAKDRKDVFSAGVSAINWLKSTESKHQELYLRGFARELQKHTNAVDSVTPNAIVGLEVLAAFGSQDALGVVLQEIVKRPVSEEHLYLVGLTHDLNLQADDSPSDDLYREVAELLRESLSEGTAEPWQSHIVVESCRVLANWAPQRLVEECGDLMGNGGELEMPAVLDAFLVAATKQKDQVDLSKWNDTASSIWAKYSADTSLPDAEGVMARLLSYDLLAGKSVADIVSKVSQLDTSTATDTLYLLGINGPEASDRSQLVQFYKHLVSRLISEGQLNALSRILPNVLKHDIQVNQILNASQ